ncbi:aminoglycoside phosphotransferase [Microbacterium sp. KR10-403]|uniref:aminoglycoside phosphotransferase n=1 Tax=Microbacterium sp. KR10-403 TaxID=3158581 RepID=UPI0032E440B4
MARSPLTLAATVTSALREAGVVDVRILTENAAGRFDSAVATLADGDRVVVRAATDAETSAELGAEARALAALTDGVRSLLPFRAPRLRGRAAQGGWTAIVVDHLDGYRVEPAHLPAGRGAATSIGAALAAVHALPESVARGAALPQLGASQVRDDVSRLLDRVATVHRVPVSLLSRWSRALAEERLWRFESTLTLGGASADAFLVEDRDGVPTVTGLLAWQGLGIGDPAVDLRWLSSAPDAADDVLAAYVTASVRTPDAALRTRARLYAELEFAKWLVHGRDSGDDEILDDAVALLTSLADSVVEDDLLAEDGLDVDDAIALIGQVPGTSTAVDTSMQTDAYDLDETSFFTEDLPAERTSPDDEDPNATAPLQMDDWAAQRDEAENETDAAADAALRRWASS